MIPVSCPEYCRKMAQRPHKHYRSDKNARSLREITRNYTVMSQHSSQYSLEGTHAENPFLISLNITSGRVGHFQQMSLALGGLCFFSLTAIQEALALQKTNTSN